MGQISSPPSAILINPAIIQGAEPRLIFIETGVPADSGRWDFDINAQVLTLRALTDADAPGSIILSATRGTTDVPTVELRATAADGAFSRLILTPGTSNLEGAAAVTLDANGGDVNMFAGAGNGVGTGGDFSVVAGQGGDTGNGGPALVSAGAGGATSGNGGNLTLNAGSPNEGNGGSVTLAAKNGVGTNRSGGSVTIVAGNSTGAGVRGNITLLSIGCTATVDSTNNRLNVASADIRVSSAGRGLRVSEGANGKQGSAVLVAGTVTVANTSVTANSRIFLTSQADGGVPGFVRVSARVAGTSFTILSSNAADTSTIAYEIFEPA